MAKSDFDDISLELSSTQEEFDKKLTDYDEKDQQIIKGIYKLVIKFGFHHRVLRFIHLLIKFFTILAIAFTIGALLSVPYALVIAIVSFCLMILFVVIFRTKLASNVHKHKRIGKLLDTYNINVLELAMLVENAEMEEIKKIKENKN